MKCVIYWTADLKSSKLWSSQFWTQFKQLRTEAWKSQDFNGVWSRDLAIPVRRSNQLSYEATDIGSWSFVSSNQPVKNGCEVIYEMFRILNCRFEIMAYLIIIIVTIIIIIYTIITVILTITVAKNSSPPLSAAACSAKNIKYACILSGIISTWQD